MHANASQPLSVYRSYLAEALDLAVKEYNVLLYGGTTPLVRGNLSHGSMSDVQGAAYSGSAFSSLLFSTTACLRLGWPYQPPCFSPGDPLYPQTHQVISLYGPHQSVDKQPACLNISL